MATDSLLLKQADEVSMRGLRFLGLLPLLFFFGQVFHYWRSGELSHVLWMCNIGNLVLAIGLFLNRQKLIRVAFLWAVPGLVVWFIYVVLAWGVFLSSTLAHVGGLVVAILAVRQIGMERTAWIYAWLWYLVVQLFCRLLTPADLNVNLSHRIQPGWEPLFGAYWKFWVVLTLAVALVLWLLGIVLERIFPLRAGVNDARSSTRLLLL